MDTSGPALVPEWLKGLNSRSNHKDPSQVQTLSRNRPVVRAQKSGPSLIEQETPRNPASSNGAFSSYSRTAGVSSRTNIDCSNSNKDPLIDQRTCYGINQKSSFSGYDELKPPSDLKLNDSERLKQKSVCGRIELNRNGRGKKSNKDDRDRYQRQYNISYQGPYSESTRRFKANKNLKNVSMDSGDESDSGEESGILPMPSYASSYVSIKQKADFERSFPSLGTEKKSGNSNSNQGNTGQEKTGRLQSVRPLSGFSCPGGLANGITGSGTSGFGSDGWVSVLADVSKTDLLGNGDLSTSAQIISPTSSIPSMVPFAASVGGLNMAETLLKATPQVPTAPKLISEAQKLEELALKQSKQLIPVIRSTTKLMGRCSSKMLKSKLETAPSSTKTKQQVASSNRTPSVRAPRRREYTEHREGRNVMKDKAISTSTGPKKNTENNNFVIDEKKLWLQEKNVFFETLRKRDAQNLLPVTRNEDSSLSTVNKVNQLDGESLLVLKSVTDVKTNNSTNSVLYESEKVFLGAEIDGNEINSNGSSVKTEKCNSGVEDMDEPVHPNPMKCISFMGSSEEEEIAFMQFLGWDKYAKVEPLTDKEINAFYDQNLEALNGYFQGKPRLHFPVVHSATMARMTHSHSFDADTGFNTNENSYLQY
ncbi:hypothetical protein SUGI_0238970 [Cryptomeria japonica]|uniref:uncharacterized protein LOC131052730 n=1 Tax=Cryptomeria japonica TaxID=3369 RepID=UPI002408D742|nr:uncharacterized protein LOC131052730 [Cryptomeria japonica]XP_057843305.2 uncharacterized protein LOC131052730 [Cryptomeria japonica]GLJ14743.1 hypothetical protein SUGI_0238970 [Cryptomeria japonica]